MKIELIGINSFVFVPEEILKEIFRQSGKDKGHIPVRGSVNRRSYKQTLVRYRGHWRLYINTTILKDSPKRIGETIGITIRYDPGDRTIPPHPGLARALDENEAAKKVFDSLPASRKKEILRGRVREPQNPFFNNPATTLSIGSVTLSSPKASQSTKRKVSVSPLSL
ncbi:MAG: YdeI/OmpD-associated family protein [Bacteroidota bacterium]|nr:YdeI/OmpD-associated family protein [Bacteroidota bacterium]MDP4257333.1 YdeI/OmpD-associated family protein [Bacteroidota bacterium]